jgi:hypothetical protein
MVNEYSKAKAHRAAIVHDIFRRSQKSYLDFVDAAERRAIEVSPDKKVAWQTIFRLQRLLKKRQSWRFEYLFGRAQFDEMTLRSLTNIEERLDQGWRESEEADLKARIGSYGDLAREIDDIQSKWDPHAVDGATRVLDQDSKYREARLALADRAQKLATEMK